MATIAAMASTLRNHPLTADERAHLTEVGKPSIFLKGLVSVMRAGPSVRVASRDGCFTFPPPGRGAFIGSAGRKAIYFRRCFLILRLSDRRRHDWKAPPPSTMISAAPAMT